MYNPYLYQNAYANNQLQMQNSGFVSVANENEARNYPVAYGNSVTFKDENSPFVYTKTSISQMETPIFKKYRLVEEVSNLPVNAPNDNKPMDLSNFVTKDEFGALQKELDALKKALGEGDNV